MPADSTLGKAREHLDQSEAHLNYLKEVTSNFDLVFSREAQSFTRLSEKVGRLEETKRQPWSINPSQIGSKIIAPFEARDAERQSKNLDKKLRASSELRAREYEQDRVLDIRREDSDSQVSHTGNNPIDASLHEGQSGSPQGAVDSYQSRSFDALGSSTNVQVGRSASGAFTESQERFDDSSMISGEDRSTKRGSSGGYPVSVRAPTIASGGTGESEVSIGQYPMAIQQEGSNSYIFYGANNNSSPSDRL